MEACWLSTDQVLLNWRSEYSFIIAQSVFTNDYDIIELFWSSRIFEGWEHQWRIALVECGMLFCHQLIKNYSSFYIITHTGNASYQWIVFFILPKFSQVAILKPYKVCLSIYSPCYHVLTNQWKWWIVSQSVRISLHK